MILEYVSDVELEKKLKSDRPVVVLYSLDQDVDLKMSRILGRIAAERHNEVHFCGVKLSGDPNHMKRHGIKFTPVIRMFVGSNPVSQTAGLQPRDVISQWIDSIINRPVEELKPLNHEEMQVKIVEGEWWEAIGSGVFAGIVLMFTKHHFEVVHILMVASVAIGFLIINENFRFSWEQKAFAIALMLIVGFFGDNVLQRMLAP